jgi:hypothetical protein
LGIKFLKPVQNLVGPEAFKPPQRFGKRVKFFTIDTADLFNCGYMLVVERSHNAVHLMPVFGQLDMNRTVVGSSRRCRRSISITVLR